MWLIHKGGEEEAEIVRVVGADERLELHASEDAGSFQGLIEEACSRGVDEVVVAGGDGLVNLAVQVLATHGPEAPVLAIAPCGTANDLARHLELRRGRVADAVEDALGAACHVCTTDVLELRIDGTVRYAINQVTIGLGARATREAPQEWKDALGGGAYLINGMSELASGAAFPVEVRSGEAHTFEGACLGLSVANGAFGGGGLELHEAPSMRDGELDVAILPALGEAEVLAGVFADLLDHGERHVTRWRAEAVEITGEQVLPVNLDGEAADGRRLEVRVLPRHLRIRSRTPEDRL